MNNRERLLAILDGQSPDRIPWIPRLKLWYDARVLTDTMPERFRGMSLREVERTLDLGDPARDGRIFRVAREGVEVVTRREGPDEVTEYHTPVGSIRTTTHQSLDLEAQGLPGRVSEYLLKGPRDYGVWEWIVEHTHWEPDYDAYRAYDAEVGDNGLPMVAVGDVPFNDFVLDLAGYDSAFYQLADYPEEIAHMLAVMTAVDRERLWPVIADSPARLVAHGRHLSSQFTPPRLFEKYVLPYYQEFMPVVHERGIAVTMHADNDVSRILAHLERAGWDMMECFVTAPMVPLTLAQARAAWGDRMVLWGGLPSLLFAPSVPEDEFRAYVRDVFKTIAPGNAFILGIADNAMPDSLIDRVAWVSEYVAEHGWYPLAGG